MQKVGCVLNLVAVTAAVLGGCATASPAMDLGDGTYLISAGAAPARGGATAAMTVAHNDAQQFCAQNGSR
jgi:hypothetical protein